MGAKYKRVYGYIFFETEGKDERQIHYTHIAETQTRKQKVKG